MNNKQREVLHQHRHFLARNIAWTDDLANKLLAQGVITESILKEVQNGKEGKNNKNILSKVLENLPLRGSGIFEKFCNVLLLNGYPFIADFLRDEENSTSEAVVDVSELYKKVPLLEKHLKDQDKKHIEEFIQEKIKISTLKGLWSKEAIAREKDKAILAKQKQLEDAFEYENREKKKNEEIEELKAALAEARNETIELKSQLGYVNSKFKETEEKYKSEFGVQLKYNNANENAIKKLQDQIEKYEKVLASLEKRIRDVIHVPQRNSERDQMRAAEFKFAFIEEDLDRFIDKYNMLLEVEKQHDKLLHERNYILAHLGHSNEIEKANLLNAYRDFAVKTDEDMTTLKEQLEKHTNIIEGQKEKIEILHKEVETRTTQQKIKQAGTVWQNAMMGVMRKQLQDVKHESRIKDTRIQHYESEVNKLKVKIAELEAARKEQAAHAHAHSHAHSHVHKGSIPLDHHRHSPGMVTDDDDSDISRAENTHRRNTLLPPLGGKVLYQASDSRAQQPAVSPKRMHGKLNGYQKGMWMPPNVAMPESLVTHQLHVEKRGLQDNKQGQLGHGLGGLRAMHGKSGKTNVRI